MADDSLRSIAAGRDSARWGRARRVGLRIGLAVLGVSMGSGVGSAGDRLGAIRIAQREEARLAVTATIHATPSSEVSVPIQVGPAHALPQKSFVRLRGLPPSVSLNQGYSIGPGSWAIPLVALTTLRASVPAWVSGRYEIVIALVGVDGEQLAETSILLVISAPAAPAPQGPGEPQQGASIAAPPPSAVSRPDRSGTATPVPPSELSAEEKDRLQKLAAQAERYIAQGERYLLEGNIGVARQFFQRAADAGYAPGAMRLAATYDPVELSRSQAQGIVPNASEARRWYERARELGSPEADERLARLGRN